MNDLYSLFDSVSRGANKPFPPYNIVANSEAKITSLTVALAGYTSEEVDITQKGGMLTIEAGKKHCIADGDTIVYQGIAARPFKLSFKLADTAKVESANFFNGLLTVVVGEDSERIVKVPIELK